MREKYGFLILSMVVVFILFGCSQNKQLEYPQTVINNFYKSNYSYNYIVTSYNKKGEIAYQSEIQGTVINEPDYKEYQKRLASDLDTTPVWDEGYFWKDGNCMKARLHTPDGWIDVPTTKTPPYGYEKSVAYVLEDTETLNGAKVEVYTASYKENLGDRYHLKEDVYATISQRYFIDTKKKVLLKIETDLTDEIQQIAEINSKVSGTDPNIDIVKKIEILEVDSYDNVKIAIPPLKN